MSAEQVSRPKVAVANLREQTRGWLNAVNLHWAGVAILALVCTYLLVQMGFGWNLATSENADALAEQRVELNFAEIAAKPLEGLDVKLEAANKKADEFYMERLPVSYSEILSELGALKNKSGVRLARVNYSQPVAGSGASAADKAVLSKVGPEQSGGQLTEVLMDASLTGDYRSLVQLINGLERDRVFFVIDGVTLTGQQNGMVSLKIRLTTYLRGLVPQDEAETENAGGPPLTDADKAIEAQSAKTGGAR